MISAFNADCIPVVPCKGTVGASGDLAPLSHIALGLMGEGMMWDPEGEMAPAADVLARAGLTPIRLQAKEGLAMINGTQLIASLGAEAVERALQVAKLADYIAALSLEVLCGTSRAFDRLIHCARPHPGQMSSATRVRSALTLQKPSELSESHLYQGKVQDAYSLRCVPQVHGITQDTVRFVKSILDTELNSATDNPMVFTQAQVEASALYSAAGPYPVECDRAPCDGSPTADRTKGDDKPPRPSPHVHGGKAFGSNERVQPLGSEEVEAVEVADDPVDALAVATAKIALLEHELAAERKRKQVPAAQIPAATESAWSFFKKDSDTHRPIDGGGLIISGGNFHGEYPAKALDFLAIGVTELANISERRIERLCNPSLSGLPAFLVADGGLHSGFMIAHCTAAALASENKVLCHPASVDTISTSAAKEDHVSMGGMAARKALEVIENVETVLAIELLAACQGLEFHRPLTTTKPLEALHALVRTKVKPWIGDRVMAPDIKAALQLVQSGEALRVVEDSM